MVNMNTEIESKNEEKALAVSMSAEIVETCKAVNNTLTIAEVRPHFQAHYANAQLDVCGIMALVRDILREAQAEFPRGIEATELRKIAVAASLFTSEILAEVQSRFAAGSTRYKVQSVKNCLSTYGKQDGTIGKIQLTNGEDKPRNCAKPRCKWYRIAKQGE
jgi:hypothetical protein